MNETGNTEFLFDIGKIFTSAGDIESLLERALALAAEQLHIERGSINIYHEEADNIFIDTSYGYTDKEVKRGSYKPGEGITGTVIQTGKPMVVPSIKDEPLFLDKTGARRNGGTENSAFISVPIKTGDTVIGTISIEKITDPEESLAAELNLLSIMAIMIAHAAADRKKMLQREAQLEEENRRLRVKLSLKQEPRSSPGNIIGKAPVMKALYENILMVAPTNSTVIIMGETGTGKELIANAIHENSAKKNKPFIKVNIAAFPENLIESELFGHEKGAFTGAVMEKKGRFELANTGTIFLDEIGDLALPLQVKLLHVLQERRFERLGGTRTISLDVRVIAATHRNLEEMVSLGEFRQDLYYRLNVFPLYSPPLRERKADIVLLADYFLQKYTGEFNKNISRISSEAIDMLLCYHWPGNVRELENCIERAVIVSGETAIRSYHLPPSLQVADTAKGSANSLDEMVDQYTREIIIDHLKMCRGNITLASKQLATTKRILTYKIKNLGIDYTRYRMR
ncbi:MAG: GAF domain-containing protein [bacterium]|nr:GAF domain-containing protein [bacterium]